MTATSQNQTTPEGQAAAMTLQFGRAIALSTARHALKFHVVNRNPVSTFYWASTVDLLKRAA